ncbi:hypothetical protein BOX15_Mlig005967g1, partial [Macrostomum lignano]
SKLGGKLKERNFLEMSLKVANDSESESSVCEAYCQANTILWSVLLPPLLAVGLIGNLLIVLVFSTSTKRRRRKPVLCITMVTLACADLLVFLFPITRHWLRHAKLYISFDVQTLGTGVCKTHEFLVYFSLMFSIWMVVLVSGERFTIICFPLRRSRLLTPRRIVAVIVAIITVSALLNVHFFWTREFVWNHQLNRMSCQNARSGLDAFISKSVHPFVDMTFTAGLPLLLLVIFTGAIAHRLYQRSRQLKTLTAGLSNCSPAGRQHRLLTPTTRMVLPVPLLFIPLAMPVKFWLVVHHGKGIPGSVQPGTPEYHSVRLGWSGLLFLQFCNFACNFFIYSLMSADFRADLARLLCGRCRRRVWCRRGEQSASTRSAPPTAAAAVDAADVVVNDRKMVLASNFDDASSVYQMQLRSCRRC